MASLGLDNVHCRTMADNGGFVCKQSLRLDTEVTETTHFTFKPEPMIAANRENSQA